MNSNVLPIAARTLEFSDAAVVDGISRPTIDSAVHAPEVVPVPATASPKGRELWSDIQDDSPRAVMESPSKSAARRRKGVREQPTQRSVANTTEVNVSAGADEADSNVAGRACWLPMNAFGPWPGHDQAHPVQGSPCHTYTDAKGGVAFTMPCIEGLDVDTACIAPGDSPVKSPASKQYRDASARTPPSGGAVGSPLHHQALCINAMSPVVQATKDGTAWASFGATAEMSPARNLFSGYSDSAMWPASPCRAHRLGAGGIVGTSPTSNVIPECLTPVSSPIHDAIWSLLGSSANIPASELAVRLQAAAPDTYED